MVVSSWSCGRIFKFKKRAQTLKWGAACNNRPETKLCKDAAFCFGHVWGKWQKAEVKVKASWFCKDPSSCTFCYTNSDAVFTARRQPAGLCRPQAQPGQFLHHRPARWADKEFEKRHSLSTSFLAGEALLPFWHFSGPGSGNVCGKSEVWDRKPAEFR